MGEMLCEQQENYIDEVWFLLHHSEDEDRAVIGLKCYLDDSGSNDGSPPVTGSLPYTSWGG